jgi:hypothetical protein
MMGEFQRAELVVRTPPHHYERGGEADHLEVAGQLRRGSPLAVIGRLSMRHGQGPPWGRDACACPRQKRTITSSVAMHKHTDRRTAPENRKLGVVT